MEKSKVPDNECRNAFHGILTFSHTKTEFITYTSSQHFNNNYNSNDIQYITPKQVERGVDLYRIFSLSKSRQLHNGQSGRLLAIVLLNFLFPFFHSIEAGIPNAISSFK